MEKARDIWRDKIRLARKPILEQLDIEYMRLSEQNADTSVIIETKNKLGSFHKDLSLKKQKLQKP